MAKLPAGTVTFLFTDIEGSTRLLQELGEDYAAVGDEHAAILRRAIAAGGGVEVSTAGDSFFAVFESPPGAVQAAVAAQRELASHPWPHGGPVKVRMGVHTGEGRLAGDDYVGIDVNRAARIGDAANGGQVLLSEATRGLVERSLPPGVSLRRLGKHRLKDIEEPEVLHDLAIEGLDDEFPPPRTLDARPNNLPAQLTSFVGREEESAEVRELLGRARLVTLTGPGGTGKTRLALKVAADLLGEVRDGCFFADLSPLTDAALVPSAIAGALGVPEIAGRPMLEAVTAHLRDRELLLVLDNFEQVTDAGAVVEELLTSASKLRVLVTSRVVLSIRGEHEYEVPPLAPPDLRGVLDLTALQDVAAVRLFTDRAMAASPKFRVTKENASAVAGITARLDGLPLAIELAATRTKVLSPEEILPRLEQSLSILTSGTRTLPQRQRTLRDAIAWSYDLLEPAEQRLFARLAVFTGGWTLDSAEAVCEPTTLGLDGIEGLTSLVDQSLVRRTEEVPPRFTMLETIREFGYEQLAASGDMDEVVRRHAGYFLDLAEAAESHLTADDQGEWLDRCEREHANIRAALRWAIAAGDADRAQGGAGALWRFWQQRGHLGEGRRWFDEVLGMSAERTAARAKALLGAGGIAWWQQDRVATGRFYEEAVAIERELGDPLRIAEAVYNHSFFVAGDDIATAASMLEECLDLFRAAGDERGVAQSLGMLVIRDAEAGDWEAVVAKLEEVVAIFRKIGDRLQLGYNLIWLAAGYGRIGRAEDARGAALEALDVFLEADNVTGVGITLTDLSWLALWEGRHEDAIRFAGAADSVRERVGAPPGGFAGLLEGDPAAEARETLGEEAAQRAWDEGKAMTVAEAVALARGSS